VFQFEFDNIALEHIADQIFHFLYVHEPFLTPDCFSRLELAAYGFKSRTFDANLVLARSDGS